MEDLETLKIIKEKEQSVNEEMELLKSEKEKQIQQLESTFSLRLKENEEKLRLVAAEALEDTNRKAQAHADDILKNSREKADRIRISISDRETEKIALETLNEYLEGM